MAAAIASDDAAVAQAVEKFGEALTLELGGESLELPSFPEVALRIRKALGNPDVAVDDVVRMVGAEPSLAVRLLQLANSVALNPSGQRITSLRAAIARIGFNLARSATIAFAMSQMRRADAWRGLEVRFRQLWEESAQLAAIGHVLAQRARGVNADLAMFAGMLQAIGKLFVLTRASRHPELLRNEAVYRELQGAWHARVARAVLSRWEVGADIVAAAADIDAAAQAHAGPADLRDVLFAARYLGTLVPEAPTPAVEVFQTPPFRRLGFEPGICREVLVASAAEIASLRAALID